MDLISVIIPVYNMEKYLHDCMESIINQSYKPIEIIIVNDGSTDNSAAIIKEYTDKNDNIICVYQKNQGLSMARNTGLMHVHGKYISFVDSDDIINNRMLEILMKELTNNHADIVYTSLKRFKRIPIYKNGINDYEKKICTSKDALRHYFQSKLGNVCGGLFKTELFRNIRFPANLIYEDNLPKAKLLYKSNCTIFLDTDLYYYRITRNSITNQKFNIKKFDIIRIGQEIENYLKKSDQNFSYYKKEYYHLISEISYVNFNEALRNGVKDFGLLERGISIFYLYKILLFGLYHHFKKNSLLFVKINQSLITTIFEQNRHR
jgi:glycosyltransferase involved in cell wall biosynthesis